jgi:hypothetical protein
MPKLSLLLDVLGEGDTLVVTKLDRLAAIPFYLLGPPAAAAASVWVAWRPPWPSRDRSQTPRHNEHTRAHTFGEGN